MARAIVENLGALGVLLPRMPASQRADFSQRMTVKLSATLDALTLACADITLVTKAVDDSALADGDKDRVVCVCVFLCVRDVMDR